MRGTKIFTAILLIGAMLALVACSPASATSSNATPAPTTPAPTTPVQTTPMPAPTMPATPAPTMPATPAPTMPTTIPPATTPPAPATGSPFQVSKLSVENNMPEPNEKVNVTFTVTNTGGQGTYTAVCKVNGVQAGTKDVTLAAGASQDVQMTITAGPVGNYIITVGDQTCKMQSMIM
jgi:hypothetical protein